MTCETLAGTLIVIGVLFIIAGYLKEHNVT